MATPNYGFEKRQREQEKKRKKEEKLRAKAERKSGAGAPEDGALEPDETEEGAAQPPVAGGAQG
ncbi:hypothetical protein [Xylophilus sp.]|uniref:hypothetical protein n=1 Tax=Xylophilus sp. TaxID=2653893 RepID=UPI0013BDAE05|nr:hypothetical protein [Xylophilus sp.]KAF1043680.1 MAG: hypothetical protein GAK38_03864 [Xylophilus sp.]